MKDFQEIAFYQKCRKRTTLQRLQIHFLPFSLKVQIVVLYRKVTEVVFGLPVEEMLLRMSALYQ